jgi:hypothetical protein
MRFVRLDAQAAFLDDEIDVSLLCGAAETGLCREDLLVSCDAAGFVLTDCAAGERECVADDAGASCLCTCDDETWCQDDCPCDEQCPCDCDESESCDEECDCDPDCAGGGDGGPGEPDADTSTPDADSSTPDAAIGDGAADARTAFTSGGGGCSTIETSRSTGRWYRVLGS